MNTLYEMNLRNLANAMQELELQERDRIIFIALETLATAWAKDLSSVTQDYISIQQKGTNL